MVVQIDRRHGRRLEAVEQRLGGERRPVVDDGAPAISTPTRGLVALLLLLLAFVASMTVVRSTQLVPLLVAGSQHTLLRA